MKKLLYMFAVIILGLLLVIFKMNNELESQRKARVLISAKDSVAKARIAKTKALKDAEEEKRMLAKYRHISNLVGCSMALSQQFYQKTRNEAEVNNIYLSEDEIIEATVNRIRNWEAQNEAKKRQFVSNGGI